MKQGCCSSQQTFFYSWVIVVKAGCKQWQCCSFTDNLAVSRMIWHFLANSYLFKVSIRKKYEIWSKLTVKTPEQRHWRFYCWLWAGKYLLGSCVFYAQSLTQGQEAERLLWEKVSGIQNYLKHYDHVIEICIWCTEPYSGPC